MFTKAASSKQHQRNQRRLCLCLLCPTQYLLAPLLSLPLFRLHRLWSKCIETKVVVSKVFGRSCRHGRGGAVIPPCSMPRQSKARFATVLRTKLWMSTSPMSPFPSQERALKKLWPGSLTSPPRSRLQLEPWACRRERHRDQDPRCRDSGRDAANHCY